MSTENKFIDLKRFTLLNRIGKGSFSKVFLVKDTKTDEIYAAKVLNSKLDENSINQEILPLFYEVNLMSSLNHPSILGFIGFSPYNFHKRPYPTIITKYASNGSLRDILDLESKSCAPKDWDDTRKLITIYGIASGLLYLHQNNIMHRDMKPENILMDDYLFPKIGDFGLSKITISISKSMNLQSKNHVKGTPLYMAPEILEDKEYSFPVDVYAFSMIIFEIMTGEKPFKGLEFTQLMLKVVQGYRPKSDVKLPSAYQTLIERCWDQDPNERPNFQEIVEQLKTNEGFITDTIDKDDYYDYIDSIDDYKSSFDTSNRFHFEEFTKKRGRKTAIKKIKIEKVVEEDTKEKVVEDDDDDDDISVEEKTIEDENSDLSCKKAIEQTENNSELKEKVENEIKLVFNYNFDTIQDNNEIKYDSQSSINSEDSKRKAKKIGLFKKESNQTKQTDYPISEYNKLDKKCQDLVDKAKTDPEMQFFVGSYLIEGQENFPKNIEIGLKFLENSISGNCFESIIYYSKLLIKGKVIPRDISKAKKLLKKGLKNKDSRAFLVNGEICIVENNLSEAKKSFEKSAKMGNNEAMYKYGKMLYIEGTSKSEQEANKYFELAKRNGFEKSNRLLSAFENLNKMKEFNKFNNQTKLLLVTQIIKNDINNKWNRIIIKYNKTEMLISTNTLESSEFINFLNNFENVTIQVQYPSNLIESVKKFSFEFKKNTKSNASIHVITLSPLKSIKKEMFQDFDLLSKITISSSVKEIDDLSFDGLTSLKEVLFEKPSNVLKIGSYSFNNCSSLTQISIPSSVTKFEKSAFSGCTSLTQVLFDNPSSLTRIYGYAFDGCSSLKQISIPPSIEEIGVFAFRNCSSLKEIILPFLSKYENYDPSTVIKNENKIINIHLDKFDEYDIKLLVLGQTYCLKNNIMHKFKCIYSNKDRKDLIEVIRSNIIKQIKKLVEDLDSKEFKSENELITTAINKIKDPSFEENLTPEMVDCVNAVWKDPGVQNVYHQLENKCFYFIENVQYFLDNISRIAQTNYMPSDEDLDKVVIKIKGISKTQFKIDNRIKVELYNPGGLMFTRSEFLKLLNNVDYLLFAISLLHFDDDMNDEITFQDSINFFTDTSTSAIYINKPVLLILSNKKIFEQKLRQKPEKFKNAFPDFKGNVENVDECIEYYKAFYLNELSKKRSIDNVSAIAVDQNDKYGVFDLFQVIAQNVLSIATTD